MALLPYTTRFVSGKERQGVLEGSLEGNYDSRKEVTLVKNSIVIDISDIMSDRGFALGSVSRDGSLETAKRSV